MRRQYYLLARPHGHFDAWDVHRLVRLARDLPVLEHPLEAIAELDEPAWVHADGRLTLRQVVHHIALVEAVDPAHPIILTPEGRVMDGRHRVAHALLDGRATVRAVRFDVMPEPDHRDVHPGDLTYEDLGPP